MDEEKYLFENIPREICDIILSDVGKVEFVIMIRVCKIWKIIIRSVCSHFIKKQEFINSVAKLGYLNIMQWACENGCNWDSQICFNAAQGGHLEVLKWARENGCDWNSSTCSNAAQGGYLEILKWARENGCDWNY
jgi:hypothetical protein